MRYWSLTMAVPTAPPNAPEAPARGSSPSRGARYGRACKAGIAAVAADCDVIVFLDGDGSVCPEFIPDLVEPILAGKQDFVIGSRIRGRREPGSMNPPQLLAGWVAGQLLRQLYGVRFSDMCPFRAIRRDALTRLGMADDLWLEPRDADARGEGGPSNPGAARRSSNPSRRSLESLGQSAGQPESRGADHMDFHAPGEGPPQSGGDGGEADGQVISASIRDLKPFFSGAFSKERAMRASPPRLRPAL